MKKFVCILVSIFLFHNLQSKPVNSETAKISAVNFLINSNSEFKNDNSFLANFAPQLYDSKVNSNNDTLYYIFKMNSKGWIIMSGDDSFDPILGFSFESELDKNNLPPAFIYWMDSYTQAIDNIFKNPNKSDIPNNKYNNLIKNINLEEFQNVKTEILPLIKTKWGQKFPYNTLCPMDTIKKQRTVTGCVPTAMAQLIYYHKNPTVGKGYVKYNSLGFGILESDLSKSIYEYDKMKLNVSDYDNNESINAVSKLMLDCGLAAKTIYGVTASGTTSTNAYNAFRENFGYSCEIIDVNAINSNDAEKFFDILYENLRQGLPMYYSGGGHAFNCDGYQVGFFHFNWGWNGKSDGYFLTGTTTNHEFYSNQKVFVNLMPFRNIANGMDKFEYNETENSARPITAKFIDNSITFRHFLNIHDTNDVDYFSVTLPDDDYNYIVDASFFHATNNLLDSLINPTTIQVSIKNQFETVTLTSPARFTLDKKYKNIFKIEPAGNKSKGNYALNFKIFRTKELFIGVNVFNLNCYPPGSVVPVSWISNIGENYKIELINSNLIGEVFGSLESINDNRINWKLPDSIVQSNNYMFKISSVEFPNIIGYSDKFEIKSKDFIKLDNNELSGRNIIGRESAIKWTSNFSDNVKIELLKNGVFYANIESNAKNTGEFRWTPESIMPIGNDYQIKITKYNFPNIFCLSDMFLIRDLTNVEQIENNVILQLVSTNNTVFNFNLYNSFPQTIVLYDIFGNKIFESELNYSQSSISLNLPFLPNGIYFIKGITSNSIKVHKFIILN
jgi:hypothetical protein